jgi:hypothetical protein
VPSVIPGEPAAQCGHDQGVGQDRRLHRQGDRSEPGRGDALDAAVEMARRKPLGEEVGPRFVYTTYSRENDIAPLIALVIANALVSTPDAPVWVQVEHDERGPQIHHIGGVAFPTYSDQG